VLPETRAAKKRGHAGKAQPLHPEAMKEVEYFRWWVTAPGRRRPYLTSFPMDEQ
jgi:hypothetical protein